MARSGISFCTNHPYALPPTVTPITSLGSLRSHVPMTVPLDFWITRRITVSGPPETPVKECSNVYHPNWVIGIGKWPGSAGSAPQRVELFPPEITNPAGSVPALKTKSRRKLPFGSLMAEDQSKRLSRWCVAQFTSRYMSTCVLYPPCGNVEL